jgi:hypothetical protein
MPLHRYSGSRNEHQPFNRTREYGPDTLDRKKLYLQLHHDDSLPQEFRLDGDWGYEFNSLGYRCGEYEPAAEFRIFAVGCSNTLGVGLRTEQTWPSVFTRMFSNGQPKKTVCLMNFAQGSASNDYISRTTITQCEASAPDLLLVNFTGMARKEYIDGHKIKNLLPAEKLDDISRAFYKIYSDEEGILNALKNILLIQLYCEARSIRFLFAWGDHRLLTSHYLKHPLCGPLLSMIDRDRFCSYGLKDADVFVDKARDLVHPGPRSHHIFAGRLYDHFVRNYS